jgi:hypothetical protein
MFIEGVHHSDEQFQHDCRELSRSFLAIMKFYQNRRPTQEMLGDAPHGPETRAQAGAVTTHCLIAAAAFAVGVLIKDLPRRDRKRLREYLVHKIDEVLREHGA